MNNTSEAPSTTWQTVGCYEFEHDSNGQPTGWYRCVNGSTVDGRQPEWHQTTGEQRDNRVAFPDGRTEMRADALPVLWLGYFEDDASGPDNIVLEGRPAFINPGLMVYASPADGRRATLRRLQREVGDASMFDFRVPPGKELGGCSTFCVVFPENR